MPDFFLLGAGFSKAVSAAMPLLADLSARVRSSLKLPPSLLSFGDDIELWLTYLSQSHPWLSEADNLRNRALLHDVSRAVADVLSERTAGATSAECPAWLKELVRYWHESRSPVVTLNYDTLIERCAGELTPEDGEGEALHCSEVYPVTLTPGGQRAGMVPGALERQSFQLFKLHGSLNWYYSGSSSFAGEAIYYVPLFGTWGDARQERERDYARYVGDKVPFVVPPLADKIPYFQHETVRTLWSLAGRALRAASRVFCLGYSLPQTDITMRFFLHGNRPGQRVKVYLANTDGAIADRFRALLPGGYEVDGRFAKAGTPIPEVVDALIRGELSAA